MTHKFLILIACIFFATAAMAEDNQFDATVKLTIKGQTFELTLAEVAELKALLDQLSPQRQNVPWSDTIEIGPGFVITPNPADNSALIPVEEK